MKIQKKEHIFLKNDSAVLGLPMRLTVSLIIGTLALLAIITTILNPNIFPQKMHVSITPLVTTVEGENPENVSFTVFIQDIDGRPISGASIIIKGLGGAGAGISDSDGKAVVKLQVQIEAGLYEGYLDVSAKAAGHLTFEHQEMIKVVKGNG